LISVCILIIIYAVRLVRKSGYWDNVQVEVVEKPVVLGQSNQLFYKHHIGPYSKTAGHIKEVTSLLPKFVKVIGIYYDNPREVRDEFCQSAVGVIIPEEGQNQLEPHFATQLSRWGFERMVVPAVDRSVICRQKFTGFFSHLHLVNHTYPAMLAFIEKERLSCRLSVEVFADNELIIFSPLDHTDEFVVPELIPTEKLEEQLRSSDFNSETDVTDEENDSQGTDSETEGDTPELIDA